MLDLRNEACPFTLVLAKLALEPLPPGATLTLQLGNAQALHNVRRSLIAWGHGVVDATTPALGLCLQVTRGHDAA